MDAPSAAPPTHLHAQLWGHEVEQVDLGVVHWLLTCTNGIYLEKRGKCATDCGCRRATASGRLAAGLGLHPAGRQPGVHAHNRIACIPGRSAAARPARNDRQEVFYWTRGSGVSGGSQGKAHAPLKAGIESCTMSLAVAAVVCRRQAILGDKMPATHFPQVQTILTDR